MTDETDETDVTDDELRARLRAGDPAASLPPADPHRVARLLEDTMAERTETGTETGTGTGGAGPVVTARRTGDLRRRGPLTWLVAAVAVLLIAGGAVFALVRAGGGGGAGDTPVAGPAGSPSTTATTTELTAPAARGAARCLPPNARTLRGQDLALDATAADVTDRAVTLVPRRFYAGTPTDEVIVRAAPAQLSALVGAVRFREGERYLVSASEGEVSVCGLAPPGRSRSRTCTPRRSARDAARPAAGGRRRQPDGPAEGAGPRRGGGAVAGARRPGPARGRL